MHLSIPKNWTASDLSALAEEICRYNNSPQVEPVLRCTSDSTLANDEVEVTLVVPKFDFGWQLEQRWKKK